jgi:hypothetical protein
MIQFWVMKHIYVHHNNKVTGISVLNHWNANGVDWIQLT